MSVDVSAVTCRTWQSADWSSSGKLLSIADVEYQLGGRLRLPVYASSFSASEAEKLAASLLEGQIKFRMRQLQVDIFSGNVLFVSGMSYGYASPHVALGRRPVFWPFRSLDGKPWLETSCFRTEQYVSSLFVCMAGILDLASAMVCTVPP